MRETAYELIWGLEFRRVLFRSCPRAPCCSSGCRGPQRDIHSSNKARVYSPAWHLVEALATLVSPDGNDPAIDGFEIGRAACRERVQIAEVDEGWKKDGRREDDA